MKNFKKTLKKSIFGFTLIELLVSLGAMVMLLAIVFNTFYVSKKSYLTADELTNIRQNGRAALELLARDIRMMGFGIDLTNDQPKICYAGPYQLVFNANLDCINEDTNLNGLLDSGEDLNSNGFLDQCVDTIGQQEISMVPGNLPANVYNPPMQYTSGAETIRLTMDTGTDSDTSSGYVTYDDNEDSYFDNDGDPNTKNTENPHDYIIMRDTNGAGLQPVAFHVRGWGGANDNYPNSSNSRPMPLFQYWGHFNDDAEAPDDEPLDLWGDTDGNGILSNGEITAWVGADTPANTNAGKLVWATEDDGSGGGTAGDGILNGTEDRNGNGKLDTTLDDALMRIVITVTMESSKVDMDHDEPEVSTDENTYHYYVDEFYADIMPRNLQLKGAPGLVIAPPPTPGTSSSPTVTMTSSLTPTMTPTMTLTMTPTLTQTPTMTPTLTPTMTSGLVDCLITMTLTEYADYWEVETPVYVARLEKDTGVINYLNLTSGHVLTSDTGSSPSGGWWGHGNLLAMDNGNRIQVIHGQQSGASVLLITDNYFEKIFSVSNSNGDRTGNAFYYFRPFVIEEEIWSNYDFYSNVNYDYNTILNDYNGITVDTTIPSDFEGPISSTLGHWAGWDTANEWFPIFSWYESGGDADSFMHRNSSSNSNTFGIGRDDTVESGIHLTTYYSFHQRDDTFSGNDSYTEVTDSYWDPAICIVEKTPCGNGIAKGTYNGFKPKYGAYDFTGKANEVEFNIYCTRKVYKPIFRIDGFEAAQEGAIHVHPACDTGGTYYTCDDLRFGVWKVGDEAYVQFKFDLEPGTYHYIMKPGHLDIN
jgi:hypothetical protein